MSEQLPIWNAVGAEPPEILKTNGWQPGMKPSAQHMNWLFNRAYKCIEELQNKEYSLPIATSTVLGGVKTGTNIINTGGTISVANASTSEKGVVQLNDTLTSTSTTQALTAAQGKVLKDLTDTANQSLTEHLAEKGKHNQFTHEGVLHQINFGYNPTLGCMTFSIREVV